MNITKIALWVVGIGMATALVLPGRQTAQVLRTAGDVFDNALHTSIRG